MSGMDRAARRAAILAVVRRIPAGRVCSYGQVARLAGLGRGAREVGRVLGDLPAGSDVPWHRVLNVRGEIHRSPDSEAGRAQIEQLREEGVVVMSGRVRMREFGWQMTLDAWLWANPDDWSGGQPS